MPPKQNLHNYMKESNGCWIWMGALCGRYGHIRYKGKVRRVHRVFYELYKGPIPALCEIDHLCKRPRCVNPDHLEAVSSQENNKRSNSISAQQARKTHCSRGHEFNEQNTYKRSDGGRDCNICIQIRNSLR